MLLTIVSSMMYNFGNIVSWRADGALESFGRMDDQVKIKVRIHKTDQAVKNTDVCRVSVLNLTALLPLSR
jgi:uncharacterized protein YijF (DUF1287 family)